MSKTIILQVEVSDGLDERLLTLNLSTSPGILGASLLETCAHWDRSYELPLQITVPPRNDAMPGGEITRMVLFSDVAGPHPPPFCAWCQLPVRVGELLVWAKLGSRSEGYVHEFCVGKVQSQLPS